MVSTRACVECKPIYDERWRADNPGVVRQKAQRQRDTRGAALNAKKREQYAANPKKYGDAARGWEKRHPQKHKVIRRVIDARRRSGKLLATPGWLTEADEDSIRALYAEAVVLSETTGIPFEVDHIVPLRGKTVSGLHVPWNLQVIARSANRRKQNKLFNVG